MVVIFHTLCPMIYRMKNWLCSFHSKNRFNHSRSYRERKVQKIGRYGFQVLEASIILSRQLQKTPNNTDGTMETCDCVDSIQRTNWKWKSISFDHITTLPVSINKILIINYYSIYHRRPYAVKRKPDLM